MDPLSIVGFIVGLSTSIRSIVAAVGWITSLKNAPLEFFDLQNELETVQGYLDVLQRILSPLTTSKDVNTQLALTQVDSCLKILKEDVDSLQQLSTVLVSQQQIGIKQTVKKLKWQQHKETIAVHRDRIRRRRMDLAQAVGLLQPAQSQSHAILLLKVQSVNEKRFEALHELIQSSTETIQESISSLATRMDRSSSSPTSSTTTAISITATVQDQCPRGCQCQCHRPRRIENHSLRKIVGHYFLSYNSMPIWDPRPCDLIPLCKNSLPHGARSNSLQLHYTFPAWLIRRGLFVSAAWGSPNNSGASLHLRVPRILPFSHGVWAAMEGNDVSRLQSMLASRQVFPTDMNPNGNSLFGFAASHHKLTRIQSLLLTTGGSLFSSTSTHEMQTWARAYRAAHDPISATRHPEFVQNCRRFLSLCDKETDDNSTPIHEALIFNPTSTCTPGYRLSQLSSALTSHPRALNTRDGAGYTPLHWAINQNDLAAITLLLSSGADIEAKALLNITPLYFAVLRGYVPIVQLLINQGADVNAATLNGATPVIATATSGDIPATITEMLLAHGADPNHRTKGIGGSALFTLHRAGEFTTGSYHTGGRSKSDTTSINFQREMPEKVKETSQTGTDKLEALVRYGADINLRNWAGQTPLLFQIRYNDSGYIGALLKNGADIGIVDDEGRGILHFLGIYGLARTMKVVREFHDQMLCDDDGAFNEVVVTMRDKKGKTCAEYFKERVDNMNSTDSDLTDSSSSSVLPVLKEDIEEWVLLMEALQTCASGRHVVTSSYM